MNKLKTAYIFFLFKFLYYAVLFYVYSSLVLFVLK